VRAIRAAAVVAAGGAAYALDAHVFRAGWLCVRTDAGARGWIRACVAC
jgi:hypothetical protein